MNDRSAAELLLALPDAKQRIDYAAHRLIYLADRNSELRSALAHICDKLDDMGTDEAGRLVAYIDRLLDKEVVLS